MFWLFLFPIASWASFLTFSSPSITINTFSYLYDHYFPISFITTSSFTYPLVGRFSFGSFLHSLSLGILSVHMVWMKYADISKLLSLAPTFSLEFQSWTSNYLVDICTWTYQNHPKFFILLLASGSLCSNLINNLSFPENIKKVNNFDRPNSDVTSSVKPFMSSSYTQAECITPLLWTKIEFIAHNTCSQLLFTVTQSVDSTRMCTSGRCIHLQHLANGNYSINSCWITVLSTKYTV